MLSAFGPFVIDMYLPAMPEMTKVFSASVSSVQLGLTFCMVGLAFGQVIFGPLSDKYGRKPVLYFSLLLYNVSTLFCCLSQNIDTFNIARLLQGLGGAGAIVYSRSAPTDLYSGTCQDHCHCRCSKRNRTGSCFGFFGPIRSDLLHGRTRFRSSYIRPLKR